MTLFFQIILILLSTQVADVSFQLDSEGVEFSAFRGEDVLSIPGGSSPFSDGEPGLPGVNYSMVIPQGTTLEGVEVEIVSEITFDGIYNIAPVVCLPLNEPIPSILPHSSLYSFAPFPVNSIQDLDTGNKTGFRIASFSFVPFSWNPLTGRLSMITEATLTPVIASVDIEPQYRLSETQINTAISALESIVHNPEMLTLYSPELEAGVDGAPWVVIADSSHYETLLPLIELRATTHGSSFKSTQWIYDNYEGYDTQEKIRNYLKDAFQTQGLVYALIVGDYGETTRISSLSIGGNLMDSVTDLYFSDLDSSWDLDNDNLYGELSDGIDWYSDIYVGRFCTDVSSRLETIVEKTIAYETTSSEGAWRTTAMLAGAGLWVDDPPGYWGSFVCDSVDSRIPETWTVHKLYEDYTAHPNNQIELLNQGVSYSTLNGHGNPGGVYWYFDPPTEIVTTSNYSDIDNEGKPTVFHSMACHPGHLQELACIAERLMFWPHGGGIAVMFNSHWGFGTPPAFGPSEWLELYFAESLIQNEFYEIGVAHAVSKDEFKANVSISMQTWVLQENNLLGDPALRFVAGQLGIEEEESNSYLSSPSIYAPSPNPVSTSCAINFTMPITGTATMALYDLAGRPVETIYSGLLLEGDGSFTVDVSNLPSGCYTISFESETGLSSTQMIVLR